MKYHFPLKLVYFLCNLTVEALQVFTANALRLQSRNKANACQSYY